MNSEATHRRREFLILGTPLLGGLILVLIGYVSALHRAEDAISWIRSSGGTVAARSVSWLHVEAARDLLPVKEVVQADLSNAPGDDSRLHRLGELTTLESLVVRGPDITDDGLAHLGRLSALQQLMLVNCPQVSDSAVRQLKLAVPGLEVRFRGPAFLGVSGFPHPAGCLIQFVEPESPAAAAGLLTGDVVTRFEGTDIAGFHELAEAISLHDPDQQVEVLVTRAGKPLRLSVELGRWK